MRSIFLTLLATSVIAASAPTSQAADAPAKKDRVFELRIYTAHPGKLADLHKRFRDHTCKLFQKHGIELVGFWTPTEQPPPAKPVPQWAGLDGLSAENGLIYVVAFPSEEARQKAWKAFRDDPEWKRVYAESHKDGIIVKEVVFKVMQPVDYSPMK